MVDKTESKMSTIGKLIENEIQKGKEPQGSIAQQEERTASKVKKMLLGDLWDLCYRAHSGTSFSPERRANSYVKDYSELLQEDLELLGENQGNYKEKFIAKFSAWMSAKGRCISSMITGPANFPVRRANKANDSERNRYDEFYNWREKYFKAVKRVPTKSPEDELEIAENRLERLVVFQMEAKEINAEVRKSKITDQYEATKHLLEMGYNKHLVSCLQIRGGKLKIPAYVLTNNNATIKRTEQKVKTMQARIDRKNDWEDIQFDGGYVTIEDDRVKIFHDEKPDREIIQEIKKSGFRWSPNWVCWCRKHTGNAIYVTKQLSFIKKD